MDLTKKMNLILKGIVIVIRLLLDIKYDSSMCSSVDGCRKYIERVDEVTR